MTKEFLIVGVDERSALTNLNKAIKRHVARTDDWRYIKYPEALEYKGRSKKLRGKWRAYARIEYQ